MYGPQFLVFYGCVIAITLFICWQIVQDPTKNKPLPLIPAEPDPYQIAYLSSGVTGVVRVAILNLIQFGYLQIKEKRISQISNHPPLSQLQPLESEVFSVLSKDIFHSLWLATDTLEKKVEEYCNIYQQKLLDEELLFSLSHSFH